MNSTWKTNKEIFNFVFDEESKYSGGITYYDGIVIPKIIAGNWTIDVPEESITCVNTAVYPLVAPDVNAKTTGFVPKVPFAINTTSKGWTIDLRIKPGNPAQFLEDTAHLSGTEYAHPGVYQGKFIVNLSLGGMLIDSKTFSYMMELKSI